MSDYCISWGYIVSRMESLYGIKPDDDEYCANEKWTVDDLFGARIEEVELKM